MAPFYEIEAILLQTASERYQNGDIFLADC